MAFKNYIKYWKDAQRYVLSKILFFLLFSFSFLLSEKNRDQDSKLCICFFRILKPAYANPGYAVVTQSNSHHPIKNPNPVSESKSHLSRILPGFSITPPSNPSRHPPQTQQETLIRSESPLSHSQFNAEIIIRKEPKSQSRI